MRGVAGRYFVEVDPEAQRDLEELRAFDARSVVEALRQLRYEAEIEARNRKPRVLRVILKGRRTIDEATGSSHGE